MPWWLRPTREGRWWAKHRGCRVKHTGPLGTRLGYVEMYQCRNLDCYRHPRYFYVDTGYPFLPYWA